MKPIRLYINDYDEAIDFINHIKPICSKVYIPLRPDWELFSKNLGHKDVISATINYKEPIIRIEIIRNTYKDDIKDKNRLLKKAIEIVTGEHTSAMVVYAHDIEKLLSNNHAEIEKEKKGEV